MFEIYTLWMLLPIALALIMFKAFISSVLGKTTVEHWPYYLRQVTFCLLVFSMAVSLDILFGQYALGQLEFIPGIVLRVIIYPMLLVVFAVIADFMRARHNRRTRSASRYIYLGP